MEISAIEGGNSLANIKFSRKYLFVLKKSLTFAIETSNDQKEISYIQYKNNVGQRYLGVVTVRLGYSSNNTMKPRRLLLPMAGHIKRTCRLSCKASGLQKRRALKYYFYSEFHHIIVQPLFPFSARGVPQYPWCASLFSAIYTSDICDAIARQMSSDCATYAVRLHDICHAIVRMQFFHRNLPNSRIVILRMIDGYR